MVVGTLSLVQKVKPVDSVDTVTQWTENTVEAVDAVHSRCSTQWMQYAVELWYMVVGTLSLVQKGQTSGCSTQWTQYTMDAVE